MAGRYSGAQAIIKKEQPLAPYIHCGAHCVNLITQHACTASRVIHSALQWVHELGILFGQSGKFKSLFKEVAKSVQGSFQTIRPLCPTRWTVCSSAIHAVLKQYESVMLALSEMAAGSTDTANRANGLHDRFQQGNVVLGLLLALETIEELENLNTSLQSRTQTINGMLSAVAYVKDAFANKRNSERFQIVYTKASEKCQIPDLSPIALPRTRNPPKRLTGQACAHVHSSPSEYYKMEFYKVLDVVDMQFRERFEQEGLLMLRNLENILLTRVVDNVVQMYPELDKISLNTQLAMFRSKHNMQSSSEAASILQGMCPEVRSLFDQVETLVLLLLVTPVSSAEAERSFSGLRRLKTWLRSTMTQTRLNSVALCHLHKEKLDQL